MNIIWQTITANYEILLDWHDDVIMTSSWWKHFPRYWPFVRGIQRSPVNSPHRQWRGALMFSLICAWINGWVNNREVGDLRRHRAHYDVIVMGNYLRFKDNAARMDMASFNTLFLLNIYPVLCPLFLWLHVYIGLMTWWCHQMETFSALLAFCAGDSTVTGEVPSQRPVTRSFAVFFDLHLSTRLST